MGYITGLLGGIIALLIMGLWALDGVRDSLKSIDSKLDSLENILQSLDENSDLLIKIKTGQVRFNGEHFEDV